MSAIFNAYVYGLNLPSFWKKVKKILGIKERRRNSNEYKVGTSVVAQTNAVTLMVKYKSCDKNILT